jgi:hypothetical protein
MTSGEGLLIEIPVLGPQPDWDVAEDRSIAADRAAEGLGVDLDDDKAMELFVGIAISEYHKKLPRFL